MGKYRQQVLKAARELIIEKGIFEFSMRDLTRASGLSVGTLYREIRNKDDLLLLMSAENIRLHGFGLNQTKPLGLSAAEQIMYLIGYAPYSTDFINFDPESDVLICDCDLVTRATTSAMEEFKVYLRQHRQQVEDLVDTLIDRHVFIDNKAHVMEVTADLMILCRGTRVMRLMQTNLMFRPNSITTEKLCQLGELVLGQLNWSIDGPQLNPKKLDLAWKTAMDQSQMVSMPLKKRVQKQLEALD